MASTCKYIAPNGEPSKLYDGLVKKYGAETALKTWLNVTVNFPSNREYSRDTNGEITIKEVIKQGLVIPSFSITGKDEKLNYHTNKANELKSVFAASGIDVEVVVDLNAKQAGAFLAVDGKPTITINPNLAKDDTVFHEFGHIYVDLLGMDDPLIQKGIEQLKYTELWNKIATLYPDLSETALAKEVLTTAIGIEASKLKGVDQSRWTLWINSLFRKISELLGIEIFAAKLLARQLITGNLGDNLNGKYELHVQYQKDLDLVNDKFLDKFQVVEKALGVIKKKISTFYRNIKQEEREKDTNYVALKELEEALVEHTNTDVELGIIAFISQALLQTGKLEQRIDRIINPTVEDKANGKDKITAADLRKLMKYNSTFALANDLIDLTTTDQELKQALIDAGVYTHLLLIQQRHDKVKNSATRVAITLISQKFAGKGNAKVTAIRRQELEQEYDSLHREERKAARQKDRKLFSDKEKQEYNQKRKRWIDSMIGMETSAIALKTVERFKYILQQTNQDIAWTDRMFIDGDAINDEIIQVVMELLDAADFKTMTATNKEYDKLNELFERYSKAHTSGTQTIKYDPLIENEVELRDGKLVETGRKTKYMVSEYYSAFLVAKNAAWDAYNSEAKRYGEDSDQAQLALQEAKDWARANEVIMPDGSILPVGKWRNPQFKTISQDTTVTKEMYDYLINRIEEDDRNVPYWAKLTDEVNGHKWFKLPSVKKKGLERIYENGLFDTIKDNVKNVISRDREDSTEFGGDNVAESVSGIVNRTISVLTDEEGNEKHDIPINFRYDIAEADQSYDLPSLMLLNYSMVRNYENKQELQADIELTRELVKERKVVKQSAGFLKGALTKIDVLLDTGLTNSKPITTEGIDSNSYKALESIIEDRLYGLASRSSVRANKIASKLATYTGSVLLIGNYLSSGANLAAGVTFNWMGRLGGTYYTANDITQASIKYGADLVGIVNDFGKIRYSSKTNLLMEKFNALSDWSAVAKKFSDDNRFKQLAKTHSLHAMNALAEHSIQNVLMYAILNNTKVMDSQGNYLTKDGTTTVLAEAMSLDEAYSVIDGKLVLDERVSKNTKFDVGVGEDMEFAMSRMIRDLNAYLQGQYSDQKRSEIQRYWYGKLIMLLRKWLPRGLKYRWAGIGKVGIGKDQLGPDDIFYSRALGTITEGYYTTSLRFLHGIYLDLKALKAQVIMEESRRNIRALTKERWEGLTDNEQGNVQKTIREAATIVILTLAATALKEAGDEDDKREKFYYLASFYAIRLQKEMLTYINPSEFTNTLRSPSASLIMIDRITHAISQLVSNPTEVYATGRRKGTLKVAKDFEDLVPILKHIDRDVDEALGFLLAKRVR